MVWTAGGYASPHFGRGLGTAALLPPAGPGGHRARGAIRTVLLRLRAVGSTPLLIKGWSAARIYPEPGLRPACDVDLCVPAACLAIAVAALSASPLPCPVDLHADVPDLEDRTWTSWSTAPAWSRWVTFRPRSWIGRPGTAAVSPSDPARARSSPVVV